MKTAFTASTADIGTDETVTAWSPRAVLAAVFASLRKSAADRSLRRQLAGLDDAILRDIGIGEDEIWRVRAGDAFTPRAWL
jgi:uncharacterized protein YjiS (DUF1127 family)